MTLNDRIQTFVQLGNFLRQFQYNGHKTDKNLPYFEEFYPKFCQTIERAKHYNGWFTEENVCYALTQWGNMLTREHLTHWLSAYSVDTIRGKTIGVVMAGNIPLVGFHDFLCVLLSGHQIKAKLASNDKQLLPLLADYVCTLTPGFTKEIEFTDGHLDQIDAVIATGSTNTSRYFDYYFASLPSIIRKNRNSVAILTGNETKEDFAALGEDIFRYYGLGCRSVSKLYVPKYYDFTPFFEGIYTFHAIIDSVKYANNYDYNKAVYLMSEFKLRDNGFLLLKEGASFSSPIGTLFYEYYEDLDMLYHQLHSDSNKIQCIVGATGKGDTLPFGTTQKPGLKDYADGIDVIQFLSNIQ